MNQSLAEAFGEISSKCQIYQESFRESSGSFFAIARDSQGKYLAVKGKNNRQFEGRDITDSIRLCPLNSINAGLIREIFHELIPVPCSKPVSFGFGDRLGIATPAHVQVVKERNVFPIFAQQSVRENSRTGRNFQEVFDDAVWGCFETGYSGGYGADADHLKEVQSLKEAANAGWTMFTIDLSDYIKNPVLLSSDEKNTYWKNIPNADSLYTTFLNKEYTIGSNVHRFTAPETRRVILTFVNGLRFATDCYLSLKQAKPHFDFEISIDEISIPTTPLDHIFVVEYLRKNGVFPTSLAPRFPGEFEKAIDYKGDVHEFAESFYEHNEICRFFGGYKISIHSGSDKFAVYPFIRKYAEGFHIKTAGTSWLQAVKTIAVTNPSLYRRIHSCAIENVQKDRLGYVVHLDIQKVPDIKTISNNDLPKLFELPDTRQLIHITYGSILKSLRKEIYDTLFLFEKEHYHQVSEHLSKHLDLLGV
ncbi:MAG: tagaturonate epimerase family protein [Candidatus Omnitrophica bacterium]|nr:tagaturonate epimerase family protein [Candidatus Omnitrophota bacterium]